MTATRSSDASPSSTAQRSLADRLAADKALRQAVPRLAHREWCPASDRPDPIDLLQKSSQERMRKLLPIRYGRMLQSPFVFLRGSAIVMAADLPQNASRRSASLT